MKKMRGFFKRAIPGFLLAGLFAVNPARGAIGIDAKVSKNQATPATSVQIASFSTTAGSELLLAFISTDGVSTPNTTVTNVTGAGLSWALVKRTNVQLGTTEIWRAFSATPLTNVAVSATLSQSVLSSMTVMSFTGVDATLSTGDSAIGATGTGNGNPGAPTATLVTTRGGSLVLGVGNDWDNAVARTVGAGQSLVNQYLAPVGDTYWVQMRSTTTPASGTAVTINDTAPTGDRYNLSIVEVLSATGGGATGSISGTISPPPSGNGATVTLSQNSSTIATTTVGTSGSYGFSSVANGTYTVTPSETGFTFSPPSQSVTVNGNPATVPVFTATQVTWTISGTITPAVSGATVTLTQGATTIGTAAVSGSGTYSFSNVRNGTYTVTPSATGFTFSPPNQTVPVNGGNVTVPNFTAQGRPPSLLFPDLKDIIPPGKMSIVQTANGKQFQYTHDTFNHGPGPLVIKPVYNSASGAYQGTQYIYSQNSSGVWSLSQTIPVAGAFIFDSDHGHFHFPFVTYGLYTVGVNGGPGTPVAVSEKVSYCINDSFIYDPTLPNAGALGNLGSCSDPTSLRGLNIGAVDEYDQTDAGQSISINNLPDGTYWLKALVDRNNFLAEADKTNNETDVELTITGTTVQVIKTVIPVLNAPPSVSVVSPSNGTIISRTVQLTANTATTSGVQYLIDGQAFGSVVSTSPYTLNWDTTTVPNGAHWLAAQTTDSTGVIGTSVVVQVTVSNGASTGPIVQLTSPANGSILSATVTLYATVGSSQPISNVVFYVDFVQVGSPVMAPPYMISWDTTKVPDGQHVITVSATDSLGNVGKSVPVTLQVNNSHPANLIGTEVSLSVDGAGTLTTPVFSTTTIGDLLIAFVSYDGPTGTPQTATVNGAGLNWTLLERSNTQLGTAEIWSARVDGTVSGVTVTAQPGTGSGFHGSLTVIAFTNAAGTSVVGRTGAPNGAPDIPLPGVIAGDWVFAVGNDWDNPIARTPVAGQVLVHQRVDTQVGDTYWVQSTAAPSTANGLVDIHDSAPTTDQWNYAAVEIVATHH
jgi:hypothetical protein